MLYELILANVDVVATRKNCSYWVKICHCRLNVSSWTIHVMCLIHIAYPKLYSVLCLRFFFSCNVSSLCSSDWGAGGEIHVSCVVSVHVAFSAQLHFWLTLAASDLITPASRGLVHRAACVESVCVDSRLVSHGKHNAGIYFHVRSSLRRSINSSLLKMHLRCP